MARALDPQQIALPSRDEALTYLEALIERAIAFLDALDGDPDLEPSLGWTAHAGLFGTSDDREEENEHGSEGGLTVHDRA